MLIIAWEVIYTYFHKGREIRSRLLTQHVINVNISHVPAVRTAYEHHQPSRLFSHQVTNGNTSRRQRSRDVMKA